MQLDRCLYVTSGGEPEVIHCVSIGRGLGMLKLGYLAAFLSARIAKLYDGGYTVEEPCQPTVIIKWKWSF